MLKICHLTSVHPRYDVRIFHKECTSLVKYFDVSLVVADGKGDETITGIKIYDVGFENYGRLKRFFIVSKKIYKKAISLNCDVYHLHDPELLPVGLQLLKINKKIIYDVHEDLPRTILHKPYINFIIRPLVSRCIEFYENFASKKFSTIITATPFIKKRFVKINKNTIDINNFPIITEYDGNTNWKEKNSEVCYVGIISHIRGLEYIIEAVGECEIKLNLAGEFENNAFKENLSNKKAWKKVLYHGKVGRDKVKDILSKSKAGLVTFLPLPNHINAQPNKIFEYMSASIPVICSDFPLWKEIVEGNRCGICVNPINPEEISGAIKYIESNDEISEEMGKNGKKAVEEKFNWKFEEQKLIGIYSALDNRY